MERKTIVGLNDFVEEAEAPVEILKVGDAAERTQRERLARLRATRDAELVARAAGRRCAAPPPRIGTSYQPCWIVRVPIARCSRSGMCSRRSMAAIASRSSSDGRTQGTTPPSDLGAVGAADGGASGIGYRVVSCYLKLEPRDRNRGKYLIKFKNRVKEAVQALPRLGLDRVRPGRRGARPRAHAGTPSHSGAIFPSTQGVALFACEGIGLFEAVPLPVVYRSRLAVDRTPLVRELASVEDEFGRLLTVVFDRTARASSRSPPTQTTELPGLRADSTRGKRFHGDHDSPGWGEHTLQQPYPAGKAAASRGDRPRAVRDRPAASRARHRARRAPVPTRGRWSRSSTTTWSSG